jgi:hypothetical protein
MDNYEGAFESGELRPTEDGFTKSVVMPVKTGIQFLFVNR